MSTTVTYKGSTLTTVNNQTRTLKTAGKYMEGDIMLTDVSSSGGYVTQDQDGYIVLPATGEGGGGSKQETTGTVTGGGTSVLQIPCAFAPQEIYISGDLTGDASLRGIVTFTIIKDKHLAITNDSSTSNTQENALLIKSISGYNEENSSTEPFASYSNGVLTINTVINSTAARWASGISYSYDLIAYNGSSSGSGDEYTRTVIVPQQTVTAPSASTSILLSNTVDIFEDAKHYIVTIDGVEWFTTCETLWTENYVLGDPNWYLGTPANYVYPFGAIYESSEGITMAFSAAGQHTVKIESLVLNEK